MFYSTRKKASEPHTFSLTDIARYKSDEPTAVIQNWMRNRDVIEFLGLWEGLHNTDFKPLEFEGFRNIAEKEMSDGKISVFEDGHVLYEDIPATTNLKVICFNFYSLFCPDYDTRIKIRDVNPLPRSGVMQG